MLSERDQLAADIQAALSVPSLPTPVDPGPDSTPSQKEAYQEALRDQEVYAIMNRQGDATQSDKDRLRAEILGFLSREGYQ
jgi:hypothetical protein